MNLLCRDWCSVLLRWWVCELPMCFGALLRANGALAGGFFLIGGVIMFFDRAMHVPFFFSQVPS
jgi:hypothetical protein